jgi:hypothetical protein
MTEAQIERRVEKMMDHLDAAYMAHELTTREYNEAVQELTRWADAKFAEADKLGAGRK